MPNETLERIKNIIPLKYRYILSKIYSPKDEMFDDLNLLRNYLTESVKINTKE